MPIDVAVEQLKGALSFFENYRENEFAYAMISSKEIAAEIKIESIFREKRMISRKKQFDENINNETKKSPEESFRIYYFLYTVDQTIFSISM